MRVRFSFLLFFISFTTLFMFQRISIGLVAALVALMPLSAFADTTPTADPALAPAAGAPAPAGTLGTGTADAAASVPEVKKPVELSPELTLFMEVYFLQLKSKFYDKAYASSSEDFQKTMTLDEFTKFVVATHLGNFTSRTWTDKQWDEKTGLIGLQGEFVFGSDKNTETHTITFQMHKKGETYEILGMTETLTIQLLSSLFPKDAALQSLVGGDLSNLAKTMKNGRFLKFYNGMSKSVRKSIKLSAFTKALKSFKKEKKDIALPADGSPITIDKDFPKINKDGSVIVSGSYKNTKFTVSFTLTYSYQWEWKLSGLSVNAVAL